MIIGGPLGWYPKHVPVNEADDETEAQTTPPAEEEDDDAEDYTAGTDDAEAPDDDETADYTDGADNAGDDDDGETPTTKIPDTDTGGNSDQQIDVNVNVNNDGGGDGGDDDDGGADYTAGTDDADAGGEGEDDGGDDGTGDAADDGTEEEDTGDDMGADSRESLFDDLNAIEDQLFGDLTDEQKKLKHNELKRLFNELYRPTDKTINKIKLITNTNSNHQVIKLAAKILVELKEMIHFNITKSYYTRTFFENDVLYKQCLAQFNAVTNLLIEIAPDVSEKSESDAKDLDDKLDDLNDDDSNTTITPSNMAV